MGPVENVNKELWWTGEMFSHLLERGVEKGDND